MMSDPGDHHPLWLGTTPLVLASQSKTRFDLLIAAGIPTEVVPAHIDERGISDLLVTKGCSPQQIAGNLAAEKARAVSKTLPERVVLGADQVLACDGTMLHKPTDHQSAAAQISFLSGKTHYLHSAVNVSINSSPVASFVETAKLKMRVLSSDTIEKYLSATGAAVFTSVGGYQLERIGIHLFDRISGDHTTILGLPMVTLLNRLRTLHLVVE